MIQTNTLLQQANSYTEQLISTRHYLHAHAETGFDLKETFAYVKEQLTAMGYDPIPCGKCGLISLAGGKKPGKVFLLRADMDALPIQEEADVSFASQNGHMHACGHDMHTTMLLGAARLLKEHEDEIPGTVKLMFQSAEEIFQGSNDMIQNGLLETPHVDAALMIHVMAAMPFSEGTVIVSPAGVSAPAADIFEIRIQGKGCHGSSPNTGVDPLNAAAHILIALQELNARELSISDRAVLTIGTMHAGTAPNVIPDSVTMGGSLRTFDEDTRAFIKERMTDISQGIANVFRAEATVSFGSGCPTLTNDSDLCQLAETYLKELLGENHVFSAARLEAMTAAANPNGKKASQTAGSEDFAYVSQQVPSVMLALAAGHPSGGYIYPQHHPKVMFNDSVLPTGSAVYAYMALRWLEEHPL